jgi:hypothetical protein
MQPVEKKRGKSATPSAAGQLLPRLAQSVGDQLVAAAQEGDGQTLARLLAAGADLNGFVTGRMPSGEVVQTTPLCTAAEAGRLEAVRLLLDAGADPSHTTVDGFTPLMHVARHGPPEVLRLLLGRGAVVDAAHPASGCAAFHFACFNNQAECAETLVRAGCDVGIQTIEGVTGKQLAEVQDSKEVLRRLRALARQPFVGVLVKLVGLVGAAEHNGKRATVRPRCRSISCSLLYLFCGG